VQVLDKMALIDFDKLSKEFSGDDDFGFSAVSEEEYKAVITNAAKDAEYEASSLTASNYRSQLLELEKMIIPFLTKLHSTGDKEYIYWPNRKPVIEKQIQNILKVTRGE
jgi:hypothetical protein